MEKKPKNTGSTGEPNDNDDSNLDDNVRHHPVFKAMRDNLINDLNKERKAKDSIQERLDALEAAESERTAKQLESKKKYDEALEKRINQAKSDARKEWEAEQAVKDQLAEAKLQLVKLGFKNERFIKGALADFDHEKQTAEDFAKALAEDESNKPFLDTGKAGAGGNPDPYPTPRSGSKLLTPVEIQALRASGKPEDIARANAAAEALWVANGGTTGLPT
jgi:hypothetical protein